MWTIAFCRNESWTCCSAWLSTPPRSWGQHLVSPGGKASLAAAWLPLTPAEFRIQWSREPQSHASVSPAGLVPRSCSPAQGSSAGIMNHSPTQRSLVNMEFLQHPSFSSFSLLNHFWIIIKAQYYSVQFHAEDGCDQTLPGSSPAPV